MKPSKNKFLGLFFRLCHFLLLIPNLPFFCHLFYLHYLFFFWFFLFLFTFFPLFLSSLLSFVFATLILPALVFTAFHTLLDILSSLLLLFSNQFQNCSILAIAFLKLHSTSDLQSYQSLFYFYTTGNKYLSLLYIQ